MTKPSVSYSSLSALYYHYDLPHAPQKELEFYRSFMNHHDIIHEPMCGSGNFLLEYKKNGFNISGSDASQDMLDILFQKALALNISAKVFCSSLETIPGKDLYTLMFIPSGSFGLITDKTIAQKALKNIHGLLKRDGLFIFEAETPHAMPEVVHSWYSNTATIDASTSITRFSYPTPAVENIASVHCRYALQQNGNIVSEENETFKLRLYDKNEMLELLNQTGFSSIKICSAYSKTNEPLANDSTIIYVCKK